MSLRITRKTDRMLRILLCLRYVESQGGHLDILTRDIIEQSGMSGPHFYSVIAQLEASGLVEGRIEVLPPGVNRARHTFFHLTEEGTIWAKEIIKERDRRFSFGRWIRKTINP